MKAEIQTYQQGGNAHLLRQLGKPKYDDLKVEVGMSMSKVFYTWIEGFFAGTVIRKNGAIAAGDFHYVERARTEFKEALISELAFPKLDATDKNACYMTVTLVPEILELSKGGGKDLEREKGGTKQKLWTAANFEFLLDGFEAACRRVTKVDGFSIKQQILEYDCGGRRNPIRVPGTLEIPGMTFYVPEVDALPFIKHFSAHAVKGATPKRMAGSISMKDHAGNELCMIELKGVDVASVSPEKSSAVSEEIKQVKIEISVEEMTFKYAK